MIGHGIGIPFGQNRNAPFPGDLAFDFNTRTDLVLNNRIGDNGSLIGGYVGDFDGASDFKVNVKSVYSLASFTVKGFFKITTGTLFGCIWNNNRNIGLSDGLGLIGHIGGTLRTRPFGMATIATSKSYNDGEWHYFEHKINRDGDEVVTIDGFEEIRRDISAYSATVIPTNNWIIGSESSLASFFDGNMSKLTITDNLYYLNNHFINSIDGIAATNNGVTFTLINDIQLQSVKDALNEGYYIDGSGNKIINPQYAATTEEVVLGGKFYNGIECFSDFEPSEETMAAQSELVTNGGAEGATDFIDSNSDGLADGFAGFSDTSYSIIDTGTRYQRIEKTGTNAVLRITGFDNTKIYRIKIKGINDSSTSFRIVGDITITESINVGNYKKTVYLQPGSGNFYLGYLTAGYFDFEEISIKESPAASYLFNRLAQETASTDSVYYDSDYTFRYFMGKFDFDISPTETITAYGELDYNVIQTYLTSSYMQKIFTKISQNYGDGNEDYIDRILAYTTQKTGDELLRVLKYINYFDNTLNYVQDEDGNYVLDEYNRLLTE